MWSVGLLWLLASDRESLSLFGTARTGDGLSTGRKEKLGESALDNDSGVPTELIVPGSGLDSASSLQEKWLENLISYIIKSHKYSSFYGI